MEQCFNTQPPEGGWYFVVFTPILVNAFQHTAARRRLVSNPFNFTSYPMFQHTAARRRLGAPIGQSRHSAGVSTHSRPKAAGFRRSMSCLPIWFQHTAARRRLEPKNTSHFPPIEFQHTAARRRLVIWIAKRSRRCLFQHTAARRRLGPFQLKFHAVAYCFNTQPPEGGWSRCIASRL